MSRYMLLKWSYDFCEKFVVGLAEDDVRDEVLSLVVRYAVHLLDREAVVSGDME